MNENNSNSNNLNELNEVLFDTLRKVKSGDMEATRGDAVVRVSKTIIENSKTQLEAYKLSQGQMGRAPESLVPSAIEKTNRLRVPQDAANAYAQENGYKTVREAVNEMGNIDFKDGLRKYKRENNI